MLKFAKIFPMIICLTLNSSVDVRVVEIKELKEVKKTKNEEIIIKGRYIPTLPLPEIKEEIIEEEEVTEDIVEEAIVEEAIVEEEIIEEVRYINVNYYDITAPSNAYAYELDSFLEGTYLYGLGQAYLDAEYIYGVNAIILMSLTVEESGWGSSEVAQCRNNISGTILQGDYAYFDSFYDCIMFTARNLSLNYLEPDGMYHNGYALEQVNLRYCFKNDEVTGELVPDFAWTYKIQSITDQFLLFIGSV